jgi:hypothetical protein
MLRPRRARFRFAQYDRCSYTTSIGLNFLMRRDPGGIAKTKPDHIAEWPGLIADAQLSIRLQHSEMSLWQQGLRVMDNRLHQVGDCPARMLSPKPRMLFRRNSGQNPAQTGVDRQKFFTVAHGDKPRC